MSSFVPGLLGLGSIGRRHLRNLRTLGVEKIVGFEPNSQRARSAWEDLGIDVHTSVDAFFDSGITAALVTSPTAFHRDQTLEAIRKDLDVFVEKPVAHSAQGLAELLTIAASSDRVTMVGCNLRFHPLVKAARNALADGRVGRVLSFRAEFGSFLPDWHPWEDYRKGYSARRELGGGIILDAIHELNLIRDLIGPVVDVSCFLTNTGALEIDVEDNASMILRMADGVIGEAHLDYLQRRYSRTFKIVGTDASLVIDFAAGRVMLESRDVCDPLVESEPGWDPNEMYIDEMRHFIEVVAHRNPTICPIADGAEDLRIALAAFHSQESGRTVGVQEIDFER